jgi:hypothetical protein
MRCLALALVAFCSLPASTMAQTNGQPATTPPTAADAPITKADDRKLICVVQDADTASRLQPKRLCHTRQEWSKLGGIPK